jgi:hypothetical protein
MTKSRHVGREVDTVMSHLLDPGESMDPLFRFFIEIQV